ncbi:hypothetical protein QQS45_00830 [Alteriqipengyuania flavescens]|uniref:hypothetical protein n=1 Tax=Alteriqipengyuania flavescens TaxID=3053610 RepID=UPI0025B5FCB7|nr:hypothetical protein [Alteriqipengyuania flavescens]WJY18831.1 hypothetical protein QQW98_00830 [Alteriqipengyuania flavescens]WJY24771.1 hypothetical protein QQS45_00830 [Alteriqipengyuania flavescens]
MVRIIAPILLVLLSACGGNGEEAVPPTEVALERPIASDPDLALSNDSGAVLGLGGGSAAGMPEVDRSPETVVRIREKAVRHVGGNQAMQDAPEADETLEEAPDILTLEQRFASSGLTTLACSRTVRYGGRYSATMPQPFALYPEAALQDAAGSDGEACKLRGAVFRTPMPVQDVLDFYYTLGGKAGFQQARAEMGETQVLTGERKGRKFALYASEIGDGVTEAELLVASD